MSTIRYTVRGDYSDFNSFLVTDRGVYSAIGPSPQPGNRAFVASSRGNSIAFGNVKLSGIFADFSDNAAGVTMTGGNRGDVLRGGAGDDTLNGGDGDDVLEAGAGFDTIDGGAAVQHGQLRARERGRRLQ